MHVLKKVLFYFRSVKSTKVNKKYDLYCHIFFDISSKLNYLSNF